MPQRQRRARRQPGPLVLVALLVATVTGVRAHDPGLSSLEVNITSDTITATLSMSPADVKLLLSDTGMPQTQALETLARDAIRISVANQPLRVATAEVEGGDSGVNVRLSFASRSDREVRLTVSSDVPRRLARGHRELVVVMVDGRPVSEVMLDGGHHPVTVELVVASPSAASKAWSFLILGIAHILSGYDHLVFLAGLILAACTVRELLVALTAFTAAHSLSLAMVVVGGVHAPPSIVEPLIALSIAWVGVENLLRKRGGGRWWVVFGFGLVHGFGFAGALLELGFGSSARGVGVALLSFNVGVETGQLVAAAALLPVVYAIRSRPAWRTRLVPACSMLIVLAGGYWFVARL
jgi:hypothetical protein